MHFNLLIFVASTSALTDCEILKTAMPAVGASNCCNTTGITCNSNSRITSIIIPPAARDKSLPVAIGNLSELKEIALEGFGITGGIPESVCNLTNLVNLQMSYNKLGGSIPACIGQMTSLESFGCFECELNGSIPPSLWTMTSLRGLYLGFNELTGTLPPDIGNLAANITEIHVNNNQLSGPLPSEIGTLLNLQILHLDSNQFTGLLPDMSRLKNLTECWITTDHYKKCRPRTAESKCIGFKDFDECTDCDILSNWLPSINADTCCSSLTLGVTCTSDRITAINMNNRSIEGPIPETIVYFTELTFLNLGNNKLNSSLPAAITKLSNLTNLNLQRNPSLSGSIPSDIGALTKLRKFNATGCNLTGSIPESLWTLRSLTQLFLGENKLTGNLSASIGKLNSTLLKYLHVGQNRLSGPIPKEISNFVNLETLILDQNNFTGQLPDLSNLTRLVQCGIYTLPDVCRLPFYGVAPICTLNEFVDNCTISDDCAVIYPWTNRLDCCNVAGIHCNDLNRVSEIRLRNRNLNGPIIPGLGSLTALRILDLSNSGLMGDIPTNFNQLTSLLHLLLSGNSMNISFPLSIDKMKQLNMIDLTDNNFANVAPPARIGGLKTMPGFKMTKRGRNGSLIFMRYAVNKRYSISE